MTATSAPLDGALIIRPDGSPSWRYAVEPFQRAFVESGLSAAEVEARCGFSSRDGRLFRLLGLRRYAVGARGRRRFTTARRLSYENAVRIARALDLDLVELGL